MRLFIVKSVVATLCVLSTYPLINLWPAFTISFAYLAGWSATNMNNAIEKQWNSAG